MDEKVSSLSLSLLMLIGLVFVSSSTTVNAQEPIEVLSVVAPYANISVDGNLSDWTNIDSFNLILYNFSASDGEPSINIDFSFAYNDTHLFGYAFIPS